MIRRDFIKSLSLLAAPLSLVSGSVKAGIKGDVEQLHDALPVHLVIDRRYVSKVEDIPKFVSKVSKLHYIEQGMSGSFLAPLLDSWDKKSITTVGITLSSEFFILKTLAKERGYRIDLESSNTDISEYGDLISWKLVPDQIQKS